VADVISGRLGIDWVAARWQRQPLSQGRPHAPRQSHWPGCRQPVSPVAFGAV